MCKCQPKFGLGIRQYLTDAICDVTKNPGKERCVTAISDQACAFVCRRIKPGRPEGAIKMLKHFAY